MRFAILSINWGGQSLSNEQQLVLRNVAALHLREARKNPVTNFSHPLCEGHLIRGEQGTYGMFGGTFFRAELGTVNGEPWTMDFLLPRGSEHLVVTDDTTIISTRPLPSGKYIHEKVDQRTAALRTPDTIH